MKKACNGFKEFKPHEESLNIEFARVKDWLEYIKFFKGWELYIPQSYIRGIMDQIALPLEKRTTTNFDNRFLIGVCYWLQQINILGIQNP